jgi:hypothetical protein
MELFSIIRSAKVLELYGMPLFGVYRKRGTTEFSIMLLLRLRICWNLSRFCLGGGVGRLKLPAFLFYEWTWNPTDCLMR